MSIFKNLGKTLKKAAPLIGAGIGMYFGAPTLGAGLGTALGSGIGTLVAGGDVEDALLAALCASISKDEQAKIWTDRVTEIMTLKNV